MNKTEKNLVAAIKGGDYDKANDALTKFSALQSTTDEQSNGYFDKVEALLDVEIEEKEVIIESEKEEVSEEVVIKELPTLPRLEKRGLKAKSKSRKEVEKAFNDALEAAMVYREDNRRGSEYRFALRLVRQLGMIKKRLLR